MQRLHLFEGYGVELEYMLVDRDTLSVKPICDQILHDIAGSYESEVEVGLTSWSNEVVLHVIEIKTNGPAESLDKLDKHFQDSVNHINKLAESHGVKLLPTAMHPWMDPLKETFLWPHEYNPVYSSYDRIFGCKGHGWANLQSVHLNLPFGNDEEFGRLHAAIRIILPILPAIAASSPIVNNNVTGINDYRLEVYRNNQKAVPSIAGKIIPEAVFSEKDYNEKIFNPIYKDIAPHDPEKILQYEWLNSRGAIARFSRGTIEIRVLDIQECPSADLAILNLVVILLKKLVNEELISYESQKAWEIEPLEKIFLSSIKDGDNAIIDNPEYLKIFGIHSNKCTTGNLWKHIFKDLEIDSYELNVIFNEGNLSGRILKSLGANKNPKEIKTIYKNLSQCLSEGKMFII